VLLMMRAIKAELEAFQGRTLSFEQLASYTGEAASTAFDKLHRTHQPQVESLIRLLERLPQESRRRLVERVCRCYPTFCHPRIAHDPVQVSDLKSLLGQRTGFTMLQGASAGDARSSSPPSDMKMTGSDLSAVSFAELMSVAQTGSWRWPI